MAENISKCDLSEVMNRFEHFSNVWGDCPNVENPIQNYTSRWFKHDNTNVIENSEEKRALNHVEKKHVSKSYRNLHDSNKTMKRYNENNFSLKNPPNEFGMSTKNVVAQQDQESHAKKLKADLSTRQNLGQSPKYHSNVAEEKRKKAIQQQIQIQVDKKNIIKQALSSLDKNQNVNKKIVFSDISELEHQKEINRDNEAAKIKGHQSLFDYDDGSESEIDLKLNHQFEGQKGDKLLELQSKFASDARFTLDSRFYESGSDEGEHEILEEVRNTDEKQKHLAILESIVKRQIRPLSEIKKKLSTKAEDKMFLRFDPSREDHNKYIVKPDENKSKDTTHHVEEKRKRNVNKKKEKGNKEKNEFKGAETDKNENEKISTIKFFTMKEDLKEVLKGESGTEFSLLKLFGSKEADGSEQNLQQSEHMKKLKYSMRNPFKYDSSDSDPEQEEMTEWKNKGNVQEKPVTSWKTTLFFADSDPRIQEAMDFLREPEETENSQVYAEKRKMLKDFIRNKYKNNNRKKRFFKNKLGGKRRKIFSKRKGK